MEAGHVMSKESTKTAFARATGHLLLNLDPEEKVFIREYYGLDK